MRFQIKMKLAILLMVMLEWNTQLWSQLDFLVPLFEEYISLSKNGHLKLTVSELLSGRKFHLPRSESKRNTERGAVAHTSSPSTREAEGGGSL